MPPALSWGMTSTPMSAAQQLRQAVRGKSTDASSGGSYAEYAKVPNEHLQLTAADGHSYPLPFLRARHTSACAALTAQLRRDRDLHGRYEMDASREGDATVLTVRNHVTGETMTAKVCPYIDDDPHLGAKSRDEYARELTVARERLLAAAQTLGWQPPPPRRWTADGLQFTEDGPSTHTQVRSVAFVSSRPLTPEDVQKLMKFVEYRAAFGRRKGAGGDWDPTTGMQIGTAVRRGMQVLTVEVDWTGVRPRTTSRATLESHRTDLQRMIHRGVHPKRNADGSFVRREETRGKVNIDALEPGSDVRIYYGGRDDQQ